jgi:hypothetical protein
MGGTRRARRGGNRLCRRRRAGARACLRAARRRALGEAAAERQLQIVQRLPDLFCGLLRGLLLAL